MFRRASRLRVLDLLPVLVICLVVFAIVLVMRDQGQHSGIYGRYFQLTPRSGHLRNWDGLCVDGTLRLGPCDADDLEWIFTQGAGLVHVGSGLCLTREAGDQLIVDTCRTQPPQYWWFQKSARGNVL